MRVRYPRRAVALALALGLGAAALTACGSSDDTATESADGGVSTLTVYTDQHADLIKALTEAYTAKSGVEFKIQEKATVGQIRAEGDASRADVFLSEDPGPVAELGKDGMLVPIDKSTIEQIRPGLSSPKDLWAAYAARTRVLYYNPDLISEDQLPKHLADLADPQYKGKFAWAPSGAFVATTQYLIGADGLDQTTTFLEALRDNGVNEHKNGNVRDTVEAGKHAMGLSNHYYWWILAGQKGGPENLTSKIYHFPEEDPGNLILSSGAGVLASSDQQQAAQEFVRWLVSRDGGQQVIADDPSAQYPVIENMPSAVAGDLGDVASPTFDMDKLANSDQAKDLLKRLGMTNG